ncbi:hypothetical protein JVT61DRAFT_3967 [Boletus reticuloceps]|uniref:Uncharacterized protein n=1 Tax=Boletus reticuloceps TaxID=495285 RepID=A0A8I2YMP4_9AGAM|nr:hypothetical protein JVT61DRAFT_3967 [Boletus reticuloceps]
MDDETLVDSARSQSMSPPSTSTIASPRTTFTGGTGSFWRGSSRRLFSLADVVTELKQSNDHHAGSSPFVVAVGTLLGWIVLTA